MNKIYILLSVIFLCSSANAQLTCTQADDNPISPGTTTVTEIVSGQVPYPECAENFGQLRLGGRWYKFTASVDGIGKVTSDLASNAIVDTRLHIYSGTCGSLTCEGGNDDKEFSANNRFSEVLWPITSGVSYYIAWDNQYSDAGFDFELSETAMTCPDGSTPLTSDFDDINSIVLCFETEDADGNGSDWKLQALDMDNDSVEEDYITTGTLSNIAKEDWLFTPIIDLVENSSYSINFKYNGANGTFPANETLEVLLVDGQSSSASVLQSLFTETNITRTGDFSQAETLATLQSIPYTSSVTGEYYLAFKGASPANSGSLLLFEYSVNEETLSVVENDNVILKKTYDRASQVFTITSNSVQLEKISVYNLLGQETLTKEIKSREGRIDLSTHVDGIYLIQVIDNNHNTSTFKLLKQ